MNDKNINNEQLFADKLNDKCKDIIYCYQNAIYKYANVYFIYKWMQENFNDDIKSKLKNDDKWSGFDQRFDYCYENIYWNIYVPNFYALIIYLREFLGIIKKNIKKIAKDISKNNESFEFSNKFKISILYLFTLMIYENHDFPEPYKKPYSFKQINESIFNDLSNELDKNILDNDILNKLVSFCDKKIKIIHSNLSKILHGNMKTFEFYEKIKDDCNEMQKKLYIEINQICKILTVKNIVWHNCIDDVSFKENKIIINKEYIDKTMSVINLYETNDKFKMILESTKRIYLKK